MHAAALFAAFAPLAFGQPAANTHVWFQATGANAASTVALQGVSGGDTVLECDTSAGPTACVWDLSMMMSWDPSPSRRLVASAGTLFLGDTDKHALSNLAAGSYPWDGTNLQATNAGGQLASTRAVLVPDTLQDFDNILPGTYSALTMRLTTNKPQGDQTIDGIDLQIDSLLWTFVYHPQDPLGPAMIVQFGDAPPLPGGQVGGLAADVITIRNVPEPSSILLLLAGLRFSRNRRRVRLRASH